MQALADRQTDRQTDRSTYSINYSVSIVHTCHPPQPAPLTPITSPTLKPTYLHNARTPITYLLRETALRNKKETLPSEPSPSDDVAAVRFQLPQGVKLARRFHRDHTVQVGRL